MGRMHVLGSEGRGRIANQRDVIAEFHPVAARGLDTGVRQHADPDDLRDETATSCAVSALTNEVARSDARVRAAYSERSSTISN